MKKRLRELERRIQRFEDLEAIRRLKYAYAAVCDDCYNSERMIPLFTKDAVWDGGEDFGVHRGHDALREFFTGVSQNIEFAVHHFLQPEIDIDKGGKTATGKWYLWQACTFKGDVGVWISGLEHDKYRKVKGKWLMSEMRLELFFMTPYEEGWHKLKIMKSDA
jgi:hypothetical protein